MAGFNVVLAAAGTRTLRSMLADLVGESAVESRADATVLSVRDQAALVTVISRLHDLGLEIDRVTRSPEGAPRTNRSGRPPGGPPGR